MDRRGFLSFLGGAVIATPAMAQTAGGILTPVPQRIIGDRLVIEGLVLRGITIRDCHIIAGGEIGIEIANCHIQGAVPQTGVFDSWIETGPAPAVQISGSALPWK
jgi:hypothetical protein